MQQFNQLKAATLAVSLALGGMAFNAVAADEVVVDTYNNSNWQTPLAIEFDKIDASGNGLILPNEATKAKAFNSKTFAKADVDHDGAIDQREYVYYRTGAWPVEAPVNVVNAAMADSMQPSVVAEALPVQAEPIVAAEKRTVGNIVDDTIITTKAKAAILGAEDLKSLQISVQTYQGEVILSGFVDSESARYKAEELVANIEGVQSIKNGLEVRAN